MGTSALAGRFRRICFGSVFFAAMSATALAQVSYTPMPMDQGFGPLDVSQPTIPPDQIVAKFTAKESAFRQALNNYVYRRSVKVQTVDDDGKVDGEYYELTDVAFDSTGRRTEHVLQAPASTLERIMMSPADFADIQQRLPFVLTQEDVGQYDVTYVGKQKVDELDTYVFNVAPKVIEKKHRYFQGKIWVDAQDLQIVVTNGKNVPDDTRKGHEDLSPPFVTYREEIDGKYWFPVYTKGDGILHFLGRKRVSEPGRSHSRIREVYRLPPVQIDGQDHLRRPGCRQGSGAAERRSPARSAAAPAAKVGAESSRNARVPDVLPLRNGIHGRPKWTSGYHSHSLAAWGRRRGVEYRSVEYKSAARTHPDPVAATSKLLFYGYHHHSRSATRCQFHRQTHPRPDLRRLSPLGLPPGAARSAGAVSVAHSRSGPRPHRTGRRRGARRLLRHHRRRVHAHSRRWPPRMAAGAAREPRRGAERTPDTGPPADARTPAARRPLRAGDPVAVSRDEALFARGRYRAGAVHRRAAASRRRTWRGQRHHRHEPSRTAQRHGEHRRQRGGRYFFEV